MKKLKTNFAINYTKLNSLTTGVMPTAAELAKQSGTVNQDFPPPLDESELFSWIGISIDQQSLHIVQNINIKREGILCTLNVNM